MTGTNHAIAGAIIALSVKQPYLAVPLAFLSHFVLDVIPHYNPPNITKYDYVSHSDSWKRKMKDKYFRLIVGTDLTLLLITLISVPILTLDLVSPFVILACMLISLVPDVTAAVQFIGSIFLNKNIGSTKFDNFHVWVQWKEQPWGIWVEIACFVPLLLALIKLTQ